MSLFKDWWSFRKRCPASCGLDCILSGVTWKQLWMVVEEGIDFSSCIAEGQVNKTKSIFYVFLFPLSCSLVMIHFAQFQHQQSFNHMQEVWFPKYWYWKKLDHKIFPSYNFLTLNNSEIMLFPRKSNWTNQKLQG